MGTLKLNTTSGGSVSIQAADGASDNTVTLPAVTGANILTDASRLSSALMPAGSVLQVVNASYTTVSAFSASSSWRDSGLTVSITPSSTSSKIFITGHISAGWDYADSGYGIGYKLVRNSTDLGLGSQTGTTPCMGCITTGSNDDDYATSSFVYLDSPSSTSSTTYKIQVLARDSQAFVINACGDYGDDAITNRRLSGTSYITVMEISG